MSVERRYFRVTSGVLADRAAELQNERVAAAEQIQTFVEGIGGSGFYTNGHHGSLCAVTFDSPDRRVWKAVPCGFWPKQNTREGKALMNRIRELPPFKPMAAALLSVGLDHNSPTVVGSNGRCWFPGMTGDSERGIWFVSVPWMDSDQGRPEIVEWSPPEEWVEIKRWQIEREIEEMKAARREPAVPE